MRPGGMRGAKRCADEEPIMTTAHSLGQKRQIGDAFHSLPLLKGIMENKQLHMPIRAHPYDHQRRAFSFTCQKFGLAGHDPPPSRGVALLMEMGTGKSLTTIAVAGRLFLDQKIERMLIVAPLSILGVWQEEFRKFAGFEYSLTVLNGSDSRKIEKFRQMPTSGLQVAVINYESAWRLEKELAVWDADLIVCDEGHKIKTHNIAASKCLHRLGARARYRMLLTGTIITNKAIDVFSQYKFLNPAVFGNSFHAFRNRFFEMVGYGNHTPVLKTSMAAELTRRIHSIAFRATKAECLDLRKRRRLFALSNWSCRHGNCISSWYATATPGSRRAKSPPPTC